MTWPESVDVALCFGWIDGVRKRIDATAYLIRFTPRKPRSTWSAVNIQRALELTREGRMQPAGLHAFEARREEKSRIYAYENKDSTVFDRAQLKRFETNKNAWRFFEAQPPWYRRTAVWWVISAKKEETRRLRLDKLIEYSESARTLPHLTRQPKVQS